MTEEQERITELIEAAVLLGKATVPDLRAARRSAEEARDRDMLSGSDDIDLVIGGLDFAASTDAAIEILTVIARLRIAQGWSPTPTNEHQPEDEEA